MNDKPTTIEMECMTCPTCLRDVWIPTGNTDHCPCSLKVPLVAREPVKAQVHNRSVDEMNERLNQGD